MTQDLEAPFQKIGKRQRRSIRLSTGPESAILIRLGDWTDWIKALDKQRNKLLLSRVGNAERITLNLALRDAATWCQALAARIPAVVVLRRTYLSSSRGDDELRPHINKAPAWLSP